MKKQRTQIITVVSLLALILLAIILFRLNPSYVGQNNTVSENNNSNDVEWVAVCNEIPAIMTGGSNNDSPEDKEERIKDAISTFAMIPTESCDDDLLRDASLLGKANKTEIAAYAA